MKPIEKKKLFRKVVKKNDEINWKTTRGRARCGSWCRSRWSRKTWSGSASRRWIRITGTRRLTRRQISSRRRRGVSKCRRRGTSSCRRLRVIVTSTTSVCLTVIWRICGETGSGRWSIGRESLARCVTWWSTIIWERARHFILTWIRIVWRLLRRGWLKWSWPFWWTLRAIVRRWQIRVIFLTSWKLLHRWKLPLLVYHCDLLIILLFHSQVLTATTFSKTKCYVEQ